MIKRLLYLILICFFMGCQHEDKARVRQVNGSQLAKVQCTGCHSYPEPHLLPKQTWKTHVLPRMGYFLGFYPNASTRKEMLGKGLAAERVLKSGLFPDKPIMDSLSWVKIQEFYISKAPQAIDSVKKYEITPESGLFNPIIPRLKLSPPSTTLLSIDSKSKSIYLGDANSQGFYQLTPNGDLEKAAKVNEGAVWMERLANGQLILVMGSFSPTDNPTGFLMWLPDDQPPKVLIDSLCRPVHFSHADINGDGRKDFVIGEFGKWTGRLAWWEQLQDGSFKAHDLRSSPGATKVYVRDLNRDQLPDIVALFGQGNESIRAYLNLGEGQFQEKTLLSFPSSFGSSSFQFYDWDKDGLEDILYTAGDNADYPPVNKPYHGVYLYKNNGDMTFEQVFHLPQHGAYSAVPADFDLDGDIDLASISFFPDFQNQPEESFLFWENVGNNQFQPVALPNPTAGRWIVLADGDMDQDGDIDLAIGSLTFEVIPKMGLVEQWVNTGIPYLLLENTTR